VTRRILLFGLPLLALIGGGLALASRHRSAGPVGTAFHFEEGSFSIDELVDRLLAGLAANDLVALDALRIGEREYVNFILPGSRPEGDPASKYPEHASRYFWETQNTKSLYSLAALLQQFGGHKYTRKAVTFRGGTKTYRWYVAHKATRILAETEGGSEVEILVGSIAELDGRFKLVSFYTD